MRLLDRTCLGLAHNIVSWATAEEELPEIYQPDKSLLSASASTFIHVNDG